MEVFNWGTFDEKVFRINPQGNNSLLTGANASGKSTYIDALLTLMVPAKKDRFYNQSSGVDKKGNRTEETYVLGHYGNIQEEGKSSTSTQKLREKNTYSVILAHFKNTDLKQVTLFQVRWFSSSGELNRQFGIAHTSLEIEKDFGDFDSKGLWKRRLDKAYNSNTTKKIIEFIDGPTAYAERMASLFGMRSVKALSLFNQVVGVKVLEDLDEFIRTNMLEELDAETEFIQLKESFLTLMDAKTNIEKAKEQIKQLMPINEIAQKLTNIQVDLEQLEKTKETSVYWFAKKGVELGKKELEKCKEELHRLNDELVLLRNREETLKQEERAISISIEKDEVGSKIKDLEKEIKQLETSKTLRSKKLDDYNKIAQGVDLQTNPNEDAFIANRDKAKQLKQNTQQKIEDESENLRALKNKDDELTKSTEELVSTIQTLQKNKNNIAGREAEIRDEIIAQIGASKEEIPFIGELIKVKEDEVNWESSIEKVLHNFALRLIVPPKYYSKVNEYVNSNNLRGRIRYDKYEENYLKNFQNKNISDKSIVNKIEIKPRTQYYEWIEDYLQNQFDFVCVDNLTEFERYSEMAITQSGLIKFKKGKHEKDDRPHITKKENYVLGWDNKEKIAALKKELTNLQNQQTDNRKAITNKNSEIKNLGIFRDECHSLFSKFDKYDDINWQIYAQDILEKEKQKTDLEKTNDRVKKLQEQLSKVQVNLKQVSDVSIFDKSQEIFKKGKDIEIIEGEIERNEKTIQITGITEIVEFENNNLEILNIEFPNIRTTQSNFLKELSSRETELKNLKQQSEREVIIKINTFKQPSEEILNKFKDWRSDVNSLPDSTNLDLISEYQRFLERLEKDNLPKFEKKFNDYLQETITNKVGDFRMFFENWSDSIKENIKHLNDSLKDIDFKSKPQTYIQLVAPNKISDEVKEFRNLLEKAIPNIREVDASIDGRKNHFYNHIEPLISKLDKEEWRKKVMDVRFWFSYKAEEFYKENNQKFKTYEGMGAMSGGEKPQLTYTILCAAVAYQFGLTKEGLHSNSFRFIAIDESFTNQDGDKAKYLLELCKQLHLQFLVVTPTTNIDIVEPYISFVHFVERIEERHSWLYDMPIEQFKEEKANYLNQ
ncbi:MAG TPA: SbcC/MukB-like Walker B domain-containing protein [Williamwhitmania sp.]|nr:SbcC/MukB-like Walker B domain-containing protein [Williamwhitmania sp.]